MTGKVFGKLTVVNATEKRSANGSIICKCKCDCGNETEVLSESLISGTKSCGCLRRVADTEEMKKIHEMSVLKSRQATMETKANATNKSTGVRNISYSPEGRFLFRMKIVREGVTYSQRFYNLDEALEAKKTVIERYKRKESNWHAKL